MTYSYRQLTRDDLTAFKELLEVFGDAFEDVATYRDAVPNDAYLRGLLDKPHFIALAAFDGSRVVGGVAAYVLDKFERARAEVYIYDLAVATPHRRRGVATGMIRALKPIAKTKGAYVIFVQADPPDAPAIRLYEPEIADPAGDCLGVEHLGQRGQRGRDEILSARAAPERSSSCEARRDRRGSPWGADRWDRSRRLS